MESLKAYSASVEIAGAPYMVYILQNKQNRGVFDCYLADADDNGIYMFSLPVDARGALINPGIRTAAEIMESAIDCAGEYIDRLKK
jgi:hypothetical protein